MLRPKQEILMKLDGLGSITIQDPAGAGNSSLTLDGSSGAVSGPYSENITTYQRCTARKIGKSILAKA